MNVLAFLLVAFGLQVADCKADGLSEKSCFEKVVKERKADYRFND